MAVEGIQEKIPLGADNVLLRGMTLRNTEEAYGIVVFTGHDTKVMRNSADAVYKFSKLEKMMNNSIVVVLALQLFLAVIGAIFGCSWLAEYAHETGEDAGNSPWAPYLPDGRPPGVAAFFRLVGTWVLIMTNMVPISLMVSLEMVKYAQSYFMEQDQGMYDTEEGTEMKA